MYAGEDGMSLLSQIGCPANLKELSRDELRQVADELRQAIIQNISKTGGHFASNLGTVELTVALYATYDFPPDRFVWDTGHQAYPHKMLTGRLDLFPSLRQYKGLSGFLRREESGFDLWGAGHACTAISAALGYAVARDRQRAGERVVAVVGDASLTGGMAWEALYNAGDMQTDLTVVLNDNKMSIAENVGAMTTYLAKLRARPWFQSLESQAKSAVERLPRPLIKTAAGLKHSVTHYVAPEATGAIFEEIGYNYIGPIDGHNLDVMLDVFSHARDLKGPVFIHAITVKGKGYDFAESDARTWHGVTPFEVDEGVIQKKSAGITYTQAFAEALVTAAREDPRVVAITAAMPDGTGLSSFQRELPDRYFDVGIAEPHAVTFAAGLAAAGMRPFVAIYSTFMQRAFDNALHDVCIQNLPVRFMLDRAGLVGEDGPTHHGVFDLSFLGLIPNMVVAAPRDTEELRQMVEFAAGFDDRPIAIRYPRGTDPGLECDGQRTPIELGKAEALRAGADVAFLALGTGVATACKAASRLAERGVSASVLNMRFAKPLDEGAILEIADRCEHLVIIEENVARGGFGEAVLSLLFRRGGPMPKVRHLCIPDTFVEHGSLAQLHSDVGIDTDAAFAAACELIFGSAAVETDVVAASVPRNKR